MAISGAMLAVTAVGTGYGIYSQERAAKEAEAARNVKPLDTPKQAKLGTFATDQQKAQALALSAGGTVFSDPKANRTIGSGPATGSKALIGS